MDRLIRGVVCVCIAGVLLSAPALHPALAAPQTRPARQEQSFEPLLLDVVARGVAEGAGVIRPGAPSAIGPATRPGSVIAGRPTPVPEPEDEAATLDLSQLVEYSSGGITVQAPAAWDVIEGSAGALFDISFPDTDFYALMQDGGGDMPGLFMVVFFGSIPEALLEGYFEEATITRVELVTSAQQVPMASIHFDATLDGLEGSGAIYGISPGETSYLLFAFAPTDEWQMQLPGLELMLNSLTFDDELLTLATAEGGTLTFADANGLMELVIPEGWHASSTNDPTLPLLAADPGYHFVTAMGPYAGFDSDLAAELEGIFDPSLELDPETEALVFDLLVEAMSDEGPAFLVDEALNATFPREGAVTFRMVGEGDFGDGLMMQVVIYMDLHSDSGLVTMAFGNTEEVLAQEPLLLEMIASAVLLD